LKQVAPTLEMPDLDNNVPRDVSMAELRKAYEKAKDALAKQQEFDNLAPSDTADRTRDAVKDINDFKLKAQSRATRLDGDKHSAANAAIRDLDRDNRDIVPSTNKYFQDPTGKARNDLKGKGRTVDGELDDVFNKVKPRAVFTKPDLNQPAREVSDAEIDNAAKTSKDKIQDVKGFGHLQDEDNAENASQTSARMAKFTELVYLKATDKNMPAVSGTKLRECTRDLTDKNKNLVNAMNAYLDKPDDPDTQTNLRNAARNAENAIDKSVAAVKEASNNQKNFEDMIDDASRAIRDAASEWDADDDIVASALRIAEEMRRLAQAAREQNRKEIILRARNIAHLVKEEIINYAKPLREQCRDESVRKEISTGTTALSSFSTQLKIIASVKAAELGVGKDKTAENQLVACCQGISTSMRGTLKSTQSAKILKNK